MIALWLQILSLVSLHVLIPIAFLVYLSKASRTKLESLCWLLLSVFYIGFIYLTGSWDWLGYYIRYVWIAGLAFAVYRGYRNNRRAPWWPERSIITWVNVIFLFALSMMFMLITVGSLFGRYYTEEPLELHFPLKNGTYYVAHGGNHPVVNYHNEYQPQQYALDIVKINPWGYRAVGLYPDDLQRYAIYGDRLYSPCQGTVISTVDGFDDRVPSDYANGLPDGTPAAGNHVVIECSGVEVYIAHMKKGSIQVQAGDAVDESSWIGNVGNSGNTSEPHLHLHAEKDGVGVPIIFDGRFLVRNSLIRSSAASF
jgi:hypothetical protein